MSTTGYQGRHRKDQQGIVSGGFPAAGYPGSMALELPEEQEEALAELEDEAWPEQEDAGIVAEELGRGDAAAVGMTAVCGECGAIYWTAQGHSCRKRSPWQAHARELLLRVRYWRYPAWWPAVARARRELDLLCPGWAYPGWDSRRAVGGLA